VSGWLLDTNVVSEQRRPRPDKNVLAFVKSQPAAKLFVSSVTLAEIRFGIESTTDAAKRLELIDWLENEIRPRFADRVVPVSEEVFLRWRLMMEHGRKVRHTFSQPDLFFAATAVVHGLTVVTRNTGDFKVSRVAVFNPWTQTLP
jgi:toxin FitB